MRHGWKVLGALAVSSALAASTVGTAVAQTDVTDTTPPTAPTGFTVNFDGDDAVTIFTFNSTDDVGVTSYEILRNGVKVADTTDIGVRIGGNPAGPAWFQVVALDAAGNRSVRSAPVLYVFDLSAPSAPTDVTAEEVDDPNSRDRIKVAWVVSNDDVGIESYEILRNGQAVTSVPAFGEPSGTRLSVDFPGNPQGGLFFQVVAIDQSGKRSVRTSPVKVTLDRRGPNAPSEPEVATLVADANGPGAFATFRFRASVDDSGIRGYRLTVNGRVDGAPTFGIQEGATFEVDGDFVISTIPVALRNGHSWVQFTALDVRGNESVRSAPLVVDFGGSSTVT